MIVVETEQVKSELTLRDHAEMWWMGYGEGHIIPPRQTAQNDAMYTMWVMWAFSELA